MKTIDIETLTDEDFEIGRQAVEDALVELRDSRIAVLGRGNGLVIREADGEHSDIIRLTTEDALRVAFRAILQHRAASPTGGSR